MVSKTACAEVIGAIVLSSICCDLISWLMVFGTDDYQRLNKTVISMAQQMSAEKRRLEEVESRGGKSKSGGKPLEEARKKMTRLARVIVPAERSLNVMRLRVQVVTICFHVATLGLLVLTYADTPVAKLPFTPWRVVTGLTHLGLSGQDYSECGVTCLYAICSMALKQNMGRALGFAPPLSSANGQKVNFGPFSLDPKGLKGSASE